MSAMQRYLAQAGRTESDLSAITLADTNLLNERIQGEMGLAQEKVGEGQERLTRDLVQGEVGMTAVGTIKGLTKGAQGIARQGAYRVNSAADLYERLGGDATNLRRVANALDTGSNTFDSINRGDLSNLGQNVDSIRNAIAPTDGRAEPLPVDTGSAEANITTSVDRDLVPLPPRPPTPPQQIQQREEEELQPREIDPVSGQERQAPRSGLGDLETGQDDPAVAGLEDEEARVRFNRLARLGEDALTDANPLPTGQEVSERIAARGGQVAPTEQDLGRGFSLAEQGQQGAGRVQQGVAQAIQERLNQPPALTEDERTTEEAGQTLMDTGFFDQPQRTIDVAQQTRSKVPPEILAQQEEQAEQEGRDVSGFLRNIENKGVIARGQVVDTNLQDQIRNINPDVVDSDHNLSQQVQPTNADTTADEGRLANLSLEAEQNPSVSTFRAGEGNVEQATAEEGEERGALAGLEDKTADISKLFEGSFFDKFSGESVAEGLGSVGEVLSGIGDVALLGEGIKGLIDSKKEFSEQDQQYQAQKKALQSLGTQPQSGVGELAAGVFDTSSEPIADATFSHF